MFRLASRNECVNVIYHFMYVVYTTIVACTQA